MDSVHNTVSAKNIDAHQALEVAARMSPSNLLDYLLLSLMLIKVEYHLMS